MVKNKVTVNINGNEYILKGDESPEEMVRIASYVDNEIKKLTSLNNKLNSTFAAVLAALNITNDFLKLKREYEEFKLLSQETERQLNRMKADLSDLLKENARLHEQLEAASKAAEKSNEDFLNLKEQYENLYKEYIDKNEEYEKAYKEFELAKREKEVKLKELERVKMELSESKYRLIDLQNQLLQNQIDMVKVKKEFDEYKINKF